MAPADRSDADLRVEPARESDLSTLVEIARGSFPVPWELPTFEQEYRLAWSHLWVARRGEAGPPLGYACFWITAGEAHLLSMATLPAARGCGIGETLLRALLAECTRRRASRLLLEVRRGNGAAQALYRKLGFHDLGVRVKYYSDNGEDALVMELDLASDPPAELGGGQGGAGGG